MSRKPPSTPQGVASDMSISDQMTLVELEYYNIKYDNNQY